MNAEEQAREIVEHICNAISVWFRIPGRLQISFRERITAALSEQNKEIEQIVCRESVVVEKAFALQAKLEAAEAREAEARKVIERFTWLFTDEGELVEQHQDQISVALETAERFLSTPSPSPSKDGAGRAERETEQIMRRVEKWLNDYALRTGESVDLLGEVRRFLWGPKS